jgi:hypothetical protein
MFNLLASAQMSSSQMGYIVSVGTGLAWRIVKSNVRDPIVVGQRPKTPKHLYAGYSRQNVWPTDVTVTSTGF